MEVTTRIEIRDGSSVVGIERRRNSLDCYGRDMQLQDLESS